MLHAPCHMPKNIIHLLAAARPNFTKVAPLYHALTKAEDLQPVLIHTGQHYDLTMSDVFSRTTRPCLNQISILGWAAAAMPSRPDSHRQPGRPVVDALPGRTRQSAARRGGQKEDRPGGEHHDRFPGDAAGEH